MLSVSGVYFMLDGLSSAPPRPSRRAVHAVDPRLAAAFAMIAAPGSLPAEQHLFTDTAVVVDNHVALSVPPLHHEVVTAILRVPRRRAALAAAGRELETVLARMEADRLLTFTPAGLGLAVGWGLAYFHRWLPAALSAGRLPIDLRATRDSGRTTPALLDALEFPSDFGAVPVSLEQNEAVFVMASDSAGHVAEAHERLFGAPSVSDLFEVTSIRRGWVDGRQLGSDRESLTKQMAMAAGIPGATLIPSSAELFLGFTSTQRTALGPTRIANLESLPGLSDQWPDGYFCHGTTLHLSHLFEDVEAWYSQSSFAGRVAAAFTPAVAHRYRPGTQTIDMAPDAAFSVADVEADYAASQTAGHSTTMQPTSRLSVATRDHYGVRHPKGTSIPQRADFNTVDNPFSFSSDPARDRMSATPAAGVHFLTFMPTTDSFNRVRLAMDGRYPGGASLGSGGRTVGINTVISATHRQNFLIPPRAHRSFPLSELW
jgi:hypothetical protein